MAVKAAKGPTREELERIRERFHLAERTEKDPLGILDRDLPPEDLEILSFLVAGLSYGRVEQIQKSSVNLFARLREWTGQRGLAESLRAAPTADLTRGLRPALRGWKHRLNTEEDLLELFTVLARVLREHGSLARLYQAQLGRPAREALIAFTSALRPEQKITRGKALLAKGGTWRGTGVEWFAPSPADGGTCKRLMMWLRWMIRADEVDLGLWSAGSKLLSKELPQPSAAELFLPIDTHIFQWARAARMTKRKSANWKVVEEITQVFRTLSPEDPLRFDFSLCQAGMEAFRFRDQR